MTIRINNRAIGVGHPPFIIAEMSGNHNQSLERALHIVEAAADAGADAIKIQTYTADTMTIESSDSQFLINDTNSLWNGSNLYELYKQAYTPWEWHKPIFELASKLGLICFSSPFDETAVDYLETLGAPLYKISSFENNHLPLIRKAASTGKPLIISTGLASVAEIDECVKTARAAGCNQLSLLKCTSTYPASPESTNINTVPHMRDLFACNVGISDHTLGIGVAIASVALGASIIEKHFTLSRDDGGVDSAFSLEPKELKALCHEAKRAWQSLGEVFYGATNSENNSMIFRRSIYAVQDIRVGDVFSTENIRIIRPGYGLHPREYDRIIGKMSTKSFKRGEPLAL